MSAEFNDLVQNQIRETISRLQQPVPDQSELLALLCAPLSAVRLLPPVYHKYNTRPYTNPNDAKLFKSIPGLQSALLETVIPAWFDNLKEHKLESILFQYFCPDVFFSASDAAVLITVFAYSSLMDLPLGDFSLEALTRLSRLYPIDRLHSVVFSRPTIIPVHTKQTIWEDLIRSLISVPAKVANARGLQDVPEDLLPRQYYSRLCTRLEELVASFKRTPTPGEVRHFVSLLANKIDMS